MVLESLFDHIKNHPFEMLHPSLIPKGIYSQFKKPFQKTITNSLLMDKMYKNSTSTWVEFLIFLSLKKKIV
jgi:hypothetical protein